MIEITVKTYMGPTNDFCMQGFARYFHGVPSIAGPFGPANDLWMQRLLAGPKGPFYASNKYLECKDH